MRNTTKQSWSQSSLLHITSNSRFDFLEEVLSSLHLADSELAFFEFTSPWCIKMDYELPVSGTVTEGCIWISTPKEPTQKFQVGDTFIFPRGIEGKSYFLSSSSERPQSWITLDELWKNGQFLPFSKTNRLINPHRILLNGGGTETVKIISFNFKWYDQYYGPLIDALPELMHIRSNESGSTIIDLISKFLTEESHLELPGFGAMISLTSQLFLAHSLRTYAVVQQNEKARWLKGLSDPKLSKTLSSIHKQPGHKWTVSELAKLVGMSRSGFAKRFTSVMGDSPMDYLSSWRMHLARLALIGGETRVSELAQKLGYNSDSAFRSAFRKETGENPRSYAKNCHR